VEGRSETLHYWAAWGLDKGRYTLEEVGGTSITRNITGTSVMVGEAMSAGGGVNDSFKGTGKGC